MKEYEIWSEGYADNGGHEGAHFHGKCEAGNFDEACIKLMEAKLDKNSDGTNSIWGCRLFDNEADARKSFG